MCHSNMKKLFWILENADINLHNFFIGRVLTQWPEVMNRSKNYKFMYHLNMHKI